MTDEEINEAVARKIGEWSGCAETLPDYCHSIAAAWEIVEKFKAMALVKLNSGGWACNPTPPAFDDLVKADTASMAICLAFLKLK